MRTRFVDAISQVPAATWDALAGEGYPFLRHAFLHALEASGSVGRAAGWIPQHLLIEDGGRLVGALPLYAKSHSYGEYVFDWSWADAYRRHGLAYYPKLLCAVPFTPATGPRLLCAPGADRAALLRQAVAALDAELARGAASSWHLLFPEAEAAAEFEAAGLSLRCGVQYHWHNRGYRDFEDFLARLASRKRKTLRRERRLVREQGIEMRILEGSAITPELWDRFHTFYQTTYAKRSGHGGYLERDFFHRLGSGMREYTVMVLAYAQGEPVAGALNLRGADTLYGRYWGCTEEFAHLHFEACYYQGMDYCMARGLARFDAGAQGEHKLARGFEPVLTWSAHRIAHPAFRAAIEDFLARERPAIEDYCRDAGQALPFRRDDNGERLDLATPP